MKPSDAAVVPPLANSYWVIPSRLLAGEHPFGKDPYEAQDRLASLRGAGIDGFIDLTDKGECPAYQRLLRGNEAYVRHPIADQGVPADDAQMQLIIDAIRNGLAGGRRLYVHCRAGIGRTGLVIGCFLAQQGLDGRSALRELNRLWQQSERSKSWVSVPQTEQQADYIRRWAQRDRDSRPANASSFLESARR